MAKKINILNLTIDELEITTLNLGLKKYVALQIYEWIHNKMVFDFEQFSNISKKNQLLLKDNFYFKEIKIINHLISTKDNTEKFLFEFENKYSIETVLIKHNNRNTVCVSSQVGCPIKCSFCATGQMNFEQDLDVSDILLQFYYIELYLNEIDEKIDNVVFMGMGEPLLNYENVLKAVNILSSEKGRNFSKRNVTISTSGLTDKIILLGKTEKQINLAVSLHSIDDKKRNTLIPINKKYNLKELKKSLLNYQQLTKNRITFEYILIDNLNCETSDAFGLINFLRGFNSFVNLIPYNEVDGLDYKTPNRQKQLQFYNILNKKINTTLRFSKGEDIAAACGQLKVKKGDEIIEL